MKSKESFMESQEPSRFATASASVIKVGRQMRSNAFNIRLVFSYTVIILA